MLKKLQQLQKNTKRKPKIRYDYLKTNNELQTFEQALAAANAWHEKIAEGLEQRLKAADLLKKSLVGAKFVMELPNNILAYKLTTAQALDFESDYMGHCVGRGIYDRGVRKDTTQIYSLRDEHGEPHVTFEVQQGKIKQIKGKQNKKNIAKYMPAILDFIQAMNFEIDFDSKSIGLLKQDGKYYDIFHLPKNFVVKGDLDLSRMRLTELPDMSTVTVTGNFYCNDNQLTSLAGKPEHIDGFFYTT